MTRKGFGLAARFRAAAERHAADLSDEERAREAALEASRAARAELLSDLMALGSELPIDGVRRIEGGVEWTNGTHRLHFLESGDVELSLDYEGRADGDEHRVYAEAALAGRWIWVRRRRGREDRLPLFDQGLELLLVHALGLPEPETGRPVAQPVPSGTPEPAQKRRL